MKISYGIQIRERSSGDVWYVTDVREALKHEHRSPFALVEITRDDDGRRRRTKFSLHEIRVRFAWGGKPNGPPIEGVE